MFSPQARNLPCQKLTGFYTAEALASNFVPFTVHCILSNFRELNLTIYSHIREVKIFNLHVYV